MTPLVSCICPTYGRAPKWLHLVEEAIESFLRQDYPNKELIVLNDAYQQQLICDSKDVRVINFPFRLDTLGDKYNFAVDASNGDLICPWEDDDISLPWRISSSVKMLGDGDYWNPQRYWYLNGEGLHADHPMGVSHNCSIYRRSAWNKVGGYPSISGSQDTEMDSRLKTLTNLVTSIPTRSQWSYIYRWGVSPLHLSALPPYDETYAKEGQRELEAGTFELEPKWKQDYTALCREHLLTVPSI